VVVGKEGVAYLLKMGALGGIGGQVASRKVCAGAWGGTAWYGSEVFVPCSDGLFALSATPDSIAIQWFTGRPQLASPIVAAGAIWAIDSSTGILSALNPVDGKTKFATDIGSAVHFATPAATEGFILAAAGQSVVAISVAG